MKDFKTIQHHNDLPNNIDFEKSVGLSCIIHKNDLRSIQVANGNKIHIVNFDSNKNCQSPVLLNLLANQEVQKISFLNPETLIFLSQCLNSVPKNLFMIDVALQHSTPINHRLDLEYVVEKVLDIYIDNKIKDPNWQKASLSTNQISYIINSVMYLHDLKEALMGHSSQNNTISVITKQCQDVEHQIREELLQPEPSL